MTKFKEDQEALYVSPFTFHIEKVLLVQEYEFSDSKGWIEGTGAYLEEKDLFDDLKEARQCALEGLLKFYNKRVNQIMNHEPEFEQYDSGEMNEFGPGAGAWENGDQL